MRSIALAFYLLFPFFLSAQDERPDSLLLFRAALEREAIKEFAPRAPELYLLVWKEEREGHKYTYSRGDGTTLADLLTPEGALRPEVCAPFGPGGITNYGNRYAVVWVSPNTGLARYTAWYFERKQ